MWTRDIDSTMTARSRSHQSSEEGYAPKAARLVWTPQSNFLECSYPELECNDNASPPEGNPNLWVVLRLLDHRCLTLWSLLPSIPVRHPCLCLLYSRHCLQLLWRVLSIRESGMRAGRPHARKERNTLPGALIVVIGSSIPPYLVAFVRIS